MISPESNVSDTSGMTCPGVDQVISSGEQRSEREQDILGPSDDDLLLEC